jgi:cysteine desulfurase
MKARERFNPPRLKTVYLDYNATTPLDPEVKAAMEPFLTETWGNPSSIHHIGRRARACLDAFRERAAKVLSCKPSEITFTSGGTEANNLAILGAARALRKRGNHLITSAIEHHAVLDCFRALQKWEEFDLTILPVDAEGRIRPADLAAALRPETVLVSIMAANNEIGTLQPVAECGTLCRERGILFHTDAVQWFGKLPFSGVNVFNADLVSLCAHKFHGPKGAGLLYSRSPFHPQPVFWGGAQENEQRAGTENLAAIAGLVAAMEKFINPPVFHFQECLDWTRHLRAVISTIQGCHLLGSETAALPNTVAFATEKTDSITLLAALDLEGICASAGAACSAGSLEPSHVVSALGLGEGLARSLVRFSLGRENSSEQIARVGELLPSVILRAQSPQ